jgi:uncharacterized membrane-anchored protein
LARPLPSVTASTTRIAGPIFKLFRQPPSAMKTKLTAFLLPALIAMASFCNAQDTPAPKEQEIINIVKNLKYQQGTIDIQNGLAKLNVTPDFKYLDAEDAKAVLVKVWGNPPDNSLHVLGMLFPANLTPLDNDRWAVTISYVEEGYVKDGDFSKFDFDDELKKEQQRFRDSNKERIDKGYDPIELIGWATPPHYDAATHKLYWAKNLKFGNEPANTLNYDIRVLGRRGYLVLKSIASMDQLSEIEQNNPKILSMVNFNDGNRYADFDPKIDKVAEYGIAALVVGVAAKAGLFKLLLGMLAAFWKLILVGFAAVATSVRRLFGRRKQT